MRPAVAAAFEKVLEQHAEVFEALAQYDETPEGQDGVYPYPQRGE